MYLLPRSEINGLISSVRATELIGLVGDVALGISAIVGTPIVTLISGGSTTLTNAIVISGE
jgi:hypothetical protein